MQELKLQALLSISQVDLRKDFKEILEEILTIAAGEIGAHSGTIMLVNEETGELEMVATYGLPDDYIARIYSKGVPITHSPSGTVLGTGEYYVLPNLFKEPRTKPWHDLGHELGITAQIYMPMKRKGEVFGLLNLYMAEPHEFTGDEIAFVSIAASQAAAVIEGARLYATVLQKNLELEDEIAERKRTEEELLLHQEHLEMLVEMRTTELKNANERLQRELTERKEVENRQSELITELNSANKELKDFAHVVSHDLKTPLRGISSLAEWIATDYADKLDEEGRDLMDLMMNRTKKMHLLIDDILQYSRIGRVKEEKEEVNLNTLVSEVIDLIDLIEESEIEVVDPLPTIYCEKTRMEQVFQNLLSNAVKYMDKPKGKVTIGCTEEDGQWKFSVADNGPGIDEKHYERIFWIFQTLQPRDEVESTGVGLTIVKKIVELHGGKIWVESKVGVGSTFFFTVPKAAKDV